MGKMSFSPRTVVEQSLNNSLPSESFRLGRRRQGTIEYFENALRFLSYVDPAPALPWMYPHAEPERMGLANFSYSEVWNVNGGRLECNPEVYTCCSYLTGSGLEDILGKVAKKSRTICRSQVHLYHKTVNIDLADTQIIRNSCKKKRVQPSTYKKDARYHHTHSGSFGDDVAIDRNQLPTIRLKLQSVWFSTSALE
jgi:hypothetical protein